MTQQQSLAKKDKKSDVRMVTGYKGQEIRCRNGHRLKGQEIRCRSGKKKSKRNDEHTAIPTSVAASIKVVAYKHRRVERVGLAI